MNITFCCTNIDLHSLEEFSKLEGQGLPLHVEHCLGLCHYCAQGKMAVVNNAVVLADDPEAFRLAILASLSTSKADACGELHSA